MSSKLVSLLSPGPGRGVLKQEDPVIPLIVLLTVDANSLVAITGTAVSALKQKIVIKKQGSTAEHVLTSADQADGVLRTPDTHNSAVIFRPENQEIKLEINFLVLENGKWVPAKAMAQDYVSSELRVEDIAYAFCFHSDDGSEPVPSYHNTNVVVSLIRNK